MKTAKNDKIDEFCRLPNYRVPRVIVRRNHHRSQKLCATADENAQKWQNSRVLSTSKLPCTGGHGPLKSSPEPKTVAINSYMWYFLDTPIKFVMCYLFQNAPFCASVFSSWGSSSEARYNPWQARSFPPPFHPVLMVHVLTWIYPRAA